MESKVVFVADFNVYLYLPPKESSVLLVCLHGRTMNHQKIEKICCRLRDECNVNVASFDLPNHDERLNLPERNQDWRTNKTYAADMFSQVTRLSHDSFPPKKSP